MTTNPGSQSRGNDEVMNTTAILYNFFTMKFNAGYPKLDHTGGGFNILTHLQPL
jgi:hypothetical protein